MKSTSNRYRPPRIQYKVDAWKKRNTSAAKAAVRSAGRKKRGKTDDGAFRK